MLKTLIRAVGTAALLLATASGPSLAQDQNGKLVIYTTHPSDLVAHFAAGFTKKHGIAVETSTAGSGALVKQIKAEAGRPVADVLWGVAPDIGGAMPDLFVPYQSPELGATAPELRDPKGFNTPFTASLMVIMTNRATLPAAEHPTHWKDLGDPKWLGKVAMADPSKSGNTLAALNGWLGIYGRDEAGWQVVDAMMRNQNIVLKSGLVLRQVVEGAYALGVTTEEAAFPHVLTGAADVIHPADGTPVRPDGLFIVKGAPNDAAARLFADYLLSEEAQKDLAENFPGRRPARSGIAVPTGMMPLQDITLIAYDADWASTHRAEVLKRMRRVTLASN